VVVGIHLSLNMRRENRSNKKYQTIESVA